MRMIARTIAFLIIYFRLVDGRVATAGLLALFFFLTDIMTANIAIIDAAGKYALCRNPNTPTYWRVPEIRNA
jgi:hypothetical protein